MCRLSGSASVLCSVLLFPIMEKQNLHVGGRIRAMAGLESAFCFGAGLGLSSRLASGWGSGSSWSGATKQLEVSPTRRAQRSFFHDLCPFQIPCQPWLSFTKAVPSRCGSECPGSILL